MPRGLSRRNSQEPSPRRFCFGGSYLEFKKAKANYQLGEGRQSPQAFPRRLSRPSLAMIGVISRAATESAHHSPKNRFKSRPPRRITDRYVQNPVCFASACIAALPRAIPTRRLALESMGITISERQART